MNLFLADINKSFEDLFKAGRAGGGPRTGSAGGPRTGTPGGGPRTGAGGGPRTGAGGGPRTGGGGGMKLPKTPGAVSGGGKQIVNCPLGAACPDGGRHEMGSARYQEHVQLSMKQKQTGTKPDDESKGQAVEKPGVQPGSQNIGSLGSDQVKKPDSEPEPSGYAGQGGKYEDTLEEWREWEELYDSPRPPLHEHLRNYHSIKPDEAKQLAAKFQADIEEEEHLVAREKRFANEGAAREAAKQQAHMEANPKQYKTALRNKEKHERFMRRHKERLDKKGRKKAEAADTQKMPPLYIADTEEMPALASADTLEVQTSEIREPTPIGEVAVQQRREAPGKDELPDTADTLINMPALAEVDARGENPAEERKTIPMQAQKAPHKRRQDVPNPLDPSAAPIDSKPLDHYRLAQVARSSGDEETARSQEELARQRSNALSSEDHKKLAEELKKEGLTEAADYHSKINDRVSQYKNLRSEQEAKAAKDFEDAQKKHSETSAKAKEMADKAKAEGKKPPKEKKAAPELKKPSTDGERLKHENHTAKAARTRDLIESHLVNNTDLSPEDRRRLDRAYKMAAYHASIGYTPTATQRSEMSEVERTVRDLGIKESWEDVQTKQQAKAEAEAAKQQARQPKPKPEPRAPQTPIEEAKVNAHRARAQKLKGNLESHANNPDLGDDEKALIDSVLRGLEDHENVENVPDTELDAALKDLEKMSGTMGKKPYQSTEGGEEGGSASGGGLPRRDAAGYLISQFHSGRATGSALAASTTSPYGAAGNISPQLAGYGMHGATSAGHRLLQRVGDGHAAQEKLDKQKDAAAKEAEQQEKAAMNADRPGMRGLAGGTG